MKDDLRKKAEQLIAERYAEINTDDPEAVKRAFHELKVHQIELELQNEELRQIQVDLASAKDRYYDLYFNAPVGHVNIDLKGVIREVNLFFADLIQKDYSKLINRHLFQFVSEKDRGKFIGWYENIHRRGNKSSLEIRLKKEGNEDSVVQLFGKRIRRERDQGSELQNEFEIMITVLDTTEKWQWHRQLEEASRHLHRAIEVGKLAWWHMNVETGLVNFHRKKTDMLGYDYEDFRGKPYTVFTDLLHEDDRPVAMKAMEDHIKGIKNAYDTEYRIRSSDGEYHWFRDFGQISERSEDGKPLSITGIAVDITHRKKALLDLQESEKKYRLLAENTHDLVCLHKPTGEYDYVSPSSQHLLGYAPQELIGKTPYEFFHPDDIERIQTESHDAAIEGKVTKGIAYRFRKNDGRYVWLETYTIPVTDDSGNVIQLVTSSRDISEQKQVKDRLESERVLLNSTFNAIQGGISVFDMDLKVIQHNRTMELWTGKSLLGVDCRNVFDRCPGTCDNCEILNTIKNHESRTQTIPFTTVDGEEKSLQIHSYPLLEGDSVTGVVQYADDITEITKVRLSLEKSEQRWRKVFEKSMDGIVLADTETAHFEFANKSWYKLTGFDTSDLGEIGVPDIHFPEDLEMLMNYFKEVKNEDFSYLPEVRVRRKDGSSLWVELSAYSISQDERELIVGVFHDITDRKNTQDALAKSEALSRHILNSSPDGMYIIDRETMKFVDCNDEACRALNMTREEILECGPHDIKPHYTREQLEHFFDEILEKPGRTGQLETVHRKKGGGTIPVEIFLGATRQGERVLLVASARNISERKESERRMQLLSYVVEHSPFLIIVTDTDGDIEYVNPKFSKITGYSFEEAIGQNPRILKSGKTTTEEYKKMWTAIRSGEEWRGEVYNKTKNGDFYWAQVSISSISDENNRITHFIGIQEDITDRKRMETDLIKAKEQAEQANQAKSTFLASMSHELRTPLNSILGFSQILKLNKNKSLTEKELNFVSNILKSGNLLLDLINDVLDLSKIESGKFDLDLQPVFIKKAVTEAVDQVSTLAFKHNINVSFDADNMEHYINVDERGIKQVLMNLLSNAIKYNRQEGKVTLACEISKEGQAILNVTDTGPGISEEKITHLFEPFNRLGAETTNIEGTGIGLTITKRLVEMMDGKLTASSRVGQGTTFEIRFPLTRRETRTENKGTETPADSELNSETAEKKTILYVEDNRVNLELMESIIAGFSSLELISAESAEKGIKTAAQLQPDMILMDINLPGMDGFEALKILKESKDTRHIPVIAVTSKAMADDAEKGIKAGFTEYLTKPIMIDQFESIVNSILYEA